MVFLRKLAFRVLRTSLHVSQLPCEPCRPAGRKSFQPSPFFQASSAKKRFPALARVMCPPVGARMPGSIGRIVSIPSSSAMKSFPENPPINRAHGEAAPPSGLLPASPSIGEPLRRPSLVFPWKFHPSFTSMTRCILCIFMLRFYEMYMRITVSYTHLRAHESRHD